MDFVDERNKPEAARPSEYNVRNCNVYSQEWSELLDDGAQEGETPHEAPITQRTIFETKRMTTSAPQSSVDDTQNDIESPVLPRQRELDLCAGDCEHLKQLEEVTGEWKRVAIELNELRFRVKEDHQLLDGDLIDHAQRLRYDIWNFALQNFGDDMQNQEVQVIQRKDAPYFRHLQSTTPDLKAYLTTPAKRALLVAAFLWRVVVSEVFGQYHWAGEDVAEGLWALSGNLEPARISGSPLPQEEQSFQLWRARTANLLLQALRGRESHVQRHIERRKHSITQSTLETLGVGWGSDASGLTDQLEGVFDVAVALDRTICLQVPRVEWRYEDQSRSGAAPGFADESTKLDEGDTASLETRDGKIGLVTAPALVKRGKPTGDAFDSEQILMEMVVDYE